MTRPLASQVQYDGGTAQDVLDSAKPMASYTALRAYTGRGTSVRITARGIGGFFVLDSSDTTTADDGGTVIVDASSRRWKRIYDGAASVKWFGAVGDGSADDTAALALARAFVAANATRNRLAFPSGIYKYSASPNWAIQDAVIESQGEVRLRYTGAGNAVTIDAGGASSNHCYNLRMGYFIVEAPSTSQDGVFVRGVQPRERRRDRGRGRRQHRPRQPHVHLLQGRERLLRAPGHHRRGAVADLELQDRHQHAQRRQYLTESEKEMIAPMPDALEKIPQDIQKAFKNYGFNKDVKLEDAIAIRKKSDWFGILFQERKGGKNAMVGKGELWAIDFVPGDNDGSTWEVQNDGIDGFETVADFTKGKLEKRFF